MKDYILDTLSRPLLTDECYRELSGKDTCDIGELLQVCVMD